MKNFAVFGGIIIILIAGFIGYEYLITSEQRGEVDYLLLNINKENGLVVATNSEYEPMEYLDKSGNFAGLDIDIIKRIADKLGITLNLKEYNWDDLFLVVKKGEVDLAISSVTITTERQKEILFSIPYFNGGQSIIVRSDTDDILFPEDLKGKKVSVLKDSTCEKAALEFVDPELLSTFRSDSLTVQSLLNKTSDAVVMDYVAATFVVKNNPSLKIIGDPFTQEYYGIITRLENHLLIEEVNKVLREMKRSGELNQLIEKWIK
ncbi:MAG: transporter substrate-binding domain-containing protein [Candidatus Paceibacterota bacterium]